MVHFLAIRQQKTDYGDDYGFETVPNIGYLNPGYQNGTIYGAIVGNVLSKSTWVDGPLHDKSFEPSVCPAENVTDVCD